jgi:hypothetical protein
VSPLLTGLAKLTPEEMQALMDEAQRIERIARITALQDCLGKLCKEPVLSWDAVARAFDAAREGK